MKYNFKPGDIVIDISTKQYYYILDYRYDIIGYVYINLSDNTVGRYIFPAEIHNNVYYNLVTNILR